MFQIPVLYKILRAISPHFRCGVLARLSLGKTLKRDAKKGSDLTGLRRTPVGNVLLAAGRTN